MELEKFGINQLYLRDSKVRAANDHGKKFQSRLAASFTGIIHCFSERAFGINFSRKFIHCTLFSLHLASVNLAKRLLEPS